MTCLLPADDICHLIYNADRDILLENTQVSLYEMEHWCDKNGLNLNSEKTKVLNFYNRKKPDPEPQLVLSANPLPTCKEVKYLGLNICDNLKWDTHVGAMTSRLTSVI